MHDVAPVRLVRSGLVESPAAAVHPNPVVAAAVWAGLTAASGAGAAAAAAAAALPVAALLALVLRPTERTTDREKLQCTVPIEEVR